jgi:hypothetical protein
MIFAQQQRFSVDVMAVNWAVYSFIGVVLTVIALAFCKVAFPQGLIFAGIAAIVFHGFAIFGVSKLIKSKTASIVNDTRGIKLLEYALSSVCWVLNAVLWWYHALDVAFLFLFIPTYFATSLVTYHVCFNYFAGHKNSQKTLLMLALNVSTLAHYVLICLKIVQQ